MELDLSELHPDQQASLILLALLALALGVLGWWVSPNRLLTWTEWQVRQQQRAYRHEVRLLTRHADRLADLLDAQPDPLRAQLVVEQMARDLDETDLPALRQAEDSLRLAGEMVWAWALGTVDYDAALQSLRTAQDHIAQAAEITP